MVPTEKLFPILPVSQCLRKECRAWLLASFLNPPPPNRPALGHMMGKGKEGGLEWRNWQNSMQRPICFSHRNAVRILYPNFFLHYHWPDLVHFKTQFFFCQLSNQGSWQTDSEVAVLTTVFSLYPVWTSSILFSKSCNC